MVEEDGNYEPVVDELVPVYEVEKVLETKVVQGQRYYKVKWVGYNNRYNVWKLESELNCEYLIEEFKKARLAREARVTRRSERLQQQPLMGLMAYMVTSNMVRVAAECGEGVEGLPGDDVAEIVRYLHAKQGTLGAPEEYITGYSKEIDNMLKNRLELVETQEEVNQVYDKYPVVSLRPILEHKGAFHAR